MHFIHSSWVGISVFIGFLLAETTSKIDSTILSLHIIFLGERSEPGPADEWKEDRRLTSPVLRFFRRYGLFLWGEGSNDKERATPTHPLITHYIPPVPQAPSYRHSPSEPDVVDNEWCERLLSRVTAISPRKKVPRDRQVAPVPSHPLRSSCFLATLCGWDEPWAKGERRDTATRATMERLIIGNRWKGEDFK